MLKLLTAVALLIGLAGCASTVPKPIATEIDPPIQLTEAQNAPDAYRGRRVRWGGNIAQVSNLADATRVEIVARNLGESGRPSRADVTLGRFVAVIPGFLDPSVYAKDRQLTVVGTLDGVEVGKIGEYPYRYPVVRVETHYLWAPLRETDWRDRPPLGWYDPWYFPYRSRYDPFYPYPWWW